MALGAFRTRPTLSLCAEASEPPLYYRYLILTANLLASSAQSPDLPIFPAILAPHNHFLSSLKSHLNKPLKLNPLLPIKSSIPPGYSSILTPSWISPRLKNLKTAHTVESLTISYPNSPTISYASQMAPNPSPKLDSLIPSRIQSPLTVSETQPQSSLLSLMPSMLVSHNCHSFLLTSNI